MVRQTRKIYANKSVKDRTEQHTVRNIFPLWAIILE